MNPLLMEVAAELRDEACHMDPVHEDYEDNNSVQDATGSCYGAVLASGEELSQCSETSIQNTPCFANLLCNEEAMREVHAAFISDQLFQELGTFLQNKSLASLDLHVPPEQSKKRCSNDPGQVTSTSDNKRQRT